MAKSKKPSIRETASKRLSRIQKSKTGPFKDMGEKKASKRAVQKRESAAQMRERQRLEKEMGVTRGKKNGR